MGKRGPAKKPTVLEELQGRPGKRAIRKKEPKPEQKIPKCPRWLDGIGKYAFNELGALLDGIKVITEADKKALELLADAYSEYRRARAVVLKEGQTYESKTTDSEGNEVVVMIRPRPEVAIAQSAWKRCSDMLKQFGLTPSARTGVEKLPEKEADPMEDFLKKGGKPYEVKKG